MTAIHFPLPVTVDLAAAKTLAEDLLTHIRTSPAPSVSTDGFRQGSAALLQILVAARKLATAQGKAFIVQATPDGAFARLLAAYGLDPAHCGAPADLLSSLAAPSTQRT